MSRVATEYLLVIEPIDEESEEEESTLSCAWCLRSAGIIPDEGSHGICTEHAEEMLSLYRARRVRG